MHDTPGPPRAGTTESATGAAPAPARNDYDPRMADCLFCRIVAGEIPSATVLETPRVLIFRDIAPKAPTHLLAIPKDHHVTAAELAEADPALAGELLAAAGRAASAEGLDNGYRLIVNTGDDSGWEVRHVHVHVLGGEPLGPMLAR